MEQVTYFSFRCPSCEGRSRVTSKNAGRLVSCPHCQAEVTALPDVRPAALPQRSSAGGTGSVRRGEVGGAAATATATATATGTGSVRRAGTDTVARPITTTRYANPVGARSAGGTQELRAPVHPTLQSQARPGEARPGEVRQEHWQEPPRPATGVVMRRVTPTPFPATLEPAAPQAPPRRPASGVGAAPRPAAARPPSLNGWLAASCVATLSASCIAVWALTTAHAAERMQAEAQLQRDKANEEAGALRVQGESQERRLAQAQVELASERAATARERELVTGLQRTVGKLGEELVKATKLPDPVLSLGPQGALPAAAPGLPQPTALTAGVPVAGAR